ASLYLVVHYRQSHLFLNLKRNLKQIKNRKNHGKSLVTQSKSTHSTNGNISTFSSKINMINFEVKFKSTLKTIFNKEEMVFFISMEIEKKSLLTTQKNEEYAKMGQEGLERSEI